MGSEVVDTGAQFSSIVINEEFNQNFDINFNVKNEKTIEKDFPTAQKSMRH